MPLIILLLYYSNNVFVVDKDHAMLGSLGVVTGRNVRDGRHLPDWLEEGTNSALRDTEEDIPVLSFTALSSAQAQHLFGSSHVGSPVVLTSIEDTSSLTDPEVRGDGGKGPWTDLDKFYEEDSEDEESADEESADDSKEEQDAEDVSADQEEEEEEEEDREEDGKHEGEISQPCP